MTSGEQREKREDKSKYHIQQYYYILVGPIHFLYIFEQGCAIVYGLVLTVWRSDVAGYDQGCIEP